MHIHQKDERSADNEERDIALNRGDGRVFSAPSFPFETAHLPGHLFLETPWKF